MEFDKDGKIIVPESSGPLEDENIVFKCNWNDAGWKGLCSKKGREFNVLSKHSWCIHKKNECQFLIENGKKGWPCNESILFKDFTINPGSYLDGKKDGDDMHIRGASKGKLAFLTTLGPNENSEEERYFIGIFDISKIENDRQIIGDKKTSVVIDPRIKLRFWKYYKNGDGSFRWGTRQRYINDKIAMDILNDLSKEYDKIVGLERDKKRLDVLIKRYKQYLEE